MAPTNARQTSRTARLREQLAKPEILLVWLCGDSLRALEVGPAHGCRHWDEGIPPPAHRPSCTRPCLLPSPQMPCCFDGLSARMIEAAGFPAAFMSGFCASGARLGAPDAGLLSYGEMVDQGRSCLEATRMLPIIGDGDTGAAGLGLHGWDENGEREGCEKEGLALPGACH